MPEVKLGRISLHAAGLMAASAVVFVIALVAAPSTEAHGGVSIGIGSGFSGLIGAPVYAPPVYYAPPPVYYPAPYVAYGPPPVYRQCYYHRVHYYRRCCCC